ncbi:BON domain-containing protein [Pseudoxanthomonas wuyuanensis]|uniref:Osmotically-inducible protein Y n=1 Tax=Pseudoxanthomonas wuyuanensis TaxID=1073196 RepID=A0A286D356_9GAMM|nr:BON domain-containing protein [Pseudoxanthomonas wuyuanensis]KAF1723018.1 BON domain-containing protein [Pseudoxanthomonas wuyuanensis]SOD53067.1 hyperosmotically inducible protein [Pseudoxanthomonas wuyuanensis]
MKNYRMVSRPLLVGTLSLALSFAAGNALANPPESEEAGSKSEQPVNDTWITTKVKADLLATEDVSGLDIKVETVNGQVHLSGSVSSQAQIDKAVEVARGIDGVTRVDASALSVASAD